MVTLALALVAMPRAEAHTIGLSTAEYTANGSSVVGKLAFARGEVASLIPNIDENHDGHLAPAEVEAARRAIKEKVLGRIMWSTAGAACTPALVDVGLSEQDGLVVSGRWDCGMSGEPFELDLALLDDLAGGHRHVARVVTGSATHDEMLYGDRRKLTIVPERNVLTERGSARREEESPGSAARETRRSGAGLEFAPFTRPSASLGPVVRPAPSLRSGAGLEFAPFFKLGIEHIVTGYDHLVFLLGLVLARARLRSLVTIVTAFTVAHSITLALAVLGVWAPSPRVVEPAIALSIVYVGIENFFVEDARKRWRITFPFGLIHGFGFAGALSALALPRDVIPAALVSFNLGVEVGQLAVLAALLPVVLFLRNQTWFAPRGARAVSGAVALAGGIWFVARVVRG